MSNKKRIRKLLKRKYKPEKVYQLPRGDRVFNEFQYGIDFAKQFESVAIAAEEATRKMMPFVIAAGRTSCKTDRLMKLLAHQADIKENNIKGASPEA